MRRSKKAIKLAFGAASAICLLALMAGCGQVSAASKKSASSDQPQKTSQTVKTQTSEEKAGSSSAAGNASSTSTTSVDKTQQEASSANSAKTSQIESPAAPNFSASDEAIAVMAYVKSMGGLANVPASKLIVDVNLLALEIPAASSGDGDLKLIKVSGDEVKVTDVAFSSSSYYGKTTVYNVNDLLNEYYQNQEQQSEINSLLSQGARHNVIDFLAWMQKYEVCPSYDRNCLTGQNVEIMGNTISEGTDGTTATITLNGNEVTMVNYQQNCGGSQGCKTPIKTVWTFSADELLSRYYSTASQKQTINGYIEQSYQSNPY